MDQVGNCLELIPIVSNCIGHKNNPGSCAEDSLWQRLNMVRSCSETLKLVLPKKIERRSCTLWLHVFDEPISKGEKQLTIIVTCQSCICTFKDICHQNLCVEAFFEEPSEEPGIDEEDGQGIGMI